MTMQAPMLALTDEALVAKTRAGSDAAFAELYVRHQGAVHARCKSVLRDDDDAADATQNAMLSALRSLRTNGTPVHPRAWLLSIAHNEAISLLRRVRPTEPIDPDHGPDVVGADERLAERERLRQLVADLNALPERQRTALLLREASGLSYRRIATILGTTTGAARQSVHQARRSLRKQRVGREHGWLGFAVPLTDWLSRVTGELSASASLGSKAAVVATALVASGGAVAQIGDGGLLGAGAPALVNPPEAQALAALPKRLASPAAQARTPASARARTAAAPERATAQATSSFTPAATTEDPTSAKTAPRDAERTPKRDGTNGSGQGQGIAPSQSAGVPQDRGGQA
jgi:RNA polymerase sigma factor (sigma-70 family)